MRIQHNIMAMNSYRNLSGNNGALSKNLEKLSSGYRINRAGDDAAGLAISEKMRAQIAGLDQAQKNAQSGINLVKTAEGALTEVHDMLNRMVTLATQSANGTYEASDREKLQAEVDALIEEIDRIAENSNFNGTKLLDGSLGAGEVKMTTTSTLIAGAAVDKTMVTSVKGELEEGTYTLTVGTLSASGTWDATTTGTTVQVAFAPDDSSGAIEVSYVDLSGMNHKTAVGESITVNLGKFSVDAVVSSTGGTKANFITGLDTLTVVAAASGTVTPGSEGLQLQIGASSNETIGVNIASMSASSLSINGLSIKNVDDANTAIDTINKAIEKVSVTRGDLGAIQNRLEHTINNLGVMEENIQDAESNIRDTDIAEEMMAYTKNNILIQSAQAMLAQANQVPQGVLQLMQ